jgi:hypothetical protein
MPKTPRLKNTLALVELLAGASVVLPHNLSNGQRDLDPDIIFLPNELLQVTASDTTSITVMNTGEVDVAPAISGSILVESWHTLERAFGSDANVNLPVKPYIVHSDAGDAAQIRNPMSLPEQWIVEGIGGEGSASGPMDAQVSANFDEVMAIRDGSIVGIRARLTAPLAEGSGAITAIPTIDGVPQPLVATILGGAQDDGSTELPGVIPYGRGQLIGIQFANGDSIDPQGVTMEAWLEVYEEVPPPPPVV